MFSLVTDKKTLGLFIALSFLLAFLYADTVRWLIGIWIHDKPYSHGFFVPFISLYLFWIQRRQLQCQPAKWGTVIGGLIIGLCCLFLLLGRTGAIMQLELPSLFFIFPGIVLFLCGWRVLVALWFPLFFLQFMIPWIDPFLKYIYPVARRWAAGLGAWLLSFKYPVFHDATFIYLPDISLSVVDGCSGINFFISVTAVGLLLAYLTQKSWFRVAVVVVSSAVLTVLINGVRVALAGIMGQKYGADMLHGPGHIFRGWFVAQVGWIGIFFINWLIAKIPHESSVPLYKKGIKWLSMKPGTTPGNEKNPDLRRRLLVLVILLSAFAGYLYTFAMPRPVHLASSLDTIPSTVGPWKGQQQVWLASSRYFPGVGPELFRRYTGPEKRAVYLYIGYFPFQSVHSRLVSYHSRIFFENREEVILARSDKRQELKISYSSPVVGRQRYDVLTWFVYPDTVIADPVKAKLTGLVDAFLHHRNNGAVVLIATPATAQEGETAGHTVLKDLESFAGGIAPFISELVRDQ